MSTSERSRRRRPLPASEGFVVGGKRATTGALRAGQVKRVFVARGSRRSEGLDELLREAAGSNASVEWRDRADLDELHQGGDHQGVVALVVAPSELSDRELAGMPLAPDALVVILDGITDPQNFGASARSAEAAGVAVLITRDRRSAPLSPAAVRASTGALLHLPVARVTNLTRAIESLKDRGFTVVGLDHRSPMNIYDQAAPARPLALVVGAEDIGLSRLVAESCDQLVSIPMVGLTGSLNAAAALAVALFGYVLHPPPPQP